MLSFISYINNRLVSKLILIVGLTLLASVSTWAYFDMEYQKKKLMQEIVEGTDRLTTTIKLGTHYAMMLNSRDDINQIINNIAKQPEIKDIRIYNKEGVIKFSNEPSEVESKTNIRDEACFICHRSDPPLTNLALTERTRIFKSPQGNRRLGIISPICNEPGCSTDACHVHPEGKKILGALDVVISLRKTDEEILRFEKAILVFAVFILVITSAVIFFFLSRFVNKPIEQLIQGIRLFGKGDYTSVIPIDREDEIGQLSSAFNKMRSEIFRKEVELNRQRDEYQNLFERAPCMISVQDRNFQLVRYNQQFAARFHPKIGEHCYHAYKGLNEKCENCPVEKTFADGKSHFSEESGVNKDGTITHWILNTSPILDVRGEIIAAMEMSLDITQRKLLEKKLEKSEKKYYDIFNHIPNPVFVLDYETLEILDCNRSVFTDYGWRKDELIGVSFLQLFAEEDKNKYVEKLKSGSVLNQIRHVGKGGKALFVNIRVSLSDYPEKKVLLITTSDITKRLEAEQQLIQASKMATLGEMASGIAHELNQPLSVVKTATSFFIKKIEKDEPVDSETYRFMLKKADKNIDRATAIINHMRQFSRKSSLEHEKVQVNEVLKSAFDIFSQQLKLRGIEVIWELDIDLPKIMAEPSRLEQVFINLLLNARDAIEERFLIQGTEGRKEIILKSWGAEKRVFAEIRDTGVGFSKNVADKLFEPFFTTKKAGHGTGLGLSISYGIVRECGGEIKAVSHEIGASFIVSFPATEEAS